jgi:hypothetical protein
MSSNMVLDAKKIVAYKVKNSIWKLRKFYSCRHLLKCFKAHI